MAGMLAILALPSKWRTAIRFVSLAASLFALASAAAVFARVSGAGDFELVEFASWIPSLGVGYHLGVDGVSALLILMTAVLLPVSVLASWREIDRGVKAFHALLMLLATGMMGVFASLDLFLFYVFWEAVLIPMIFLIGAWGSAGRIAAAVKFVIFTTAGSVLMLAAILYAAVKAGSFDLMDCYSHVFTVEEQMWLFTGLAVAFAIKVPMIGLHTWLPDAHTEAPTAGSILLAGVLLKMGTYGFYRFAMPMFPAAVAWSADLMLSLAVAGIIAGALLAMVQPDLKRLVAYSSISHMGFVILGLYALERQAVAGAVLQMANHGITTGGLFLVVGMLYERRRTRMIEDFGGTARSLPALSAAFIFLGLSSMGLPGLNNFAGEFLVLMGSFQTRTPYAAAAILGLVFGAVYILWAIARVFFGPLKNEEERRMPDLRFREYSSLVPIAAIVILVGVWPQGLLEKVWRSSDAFIRLAKRVEMIAPSSKAVRPDSARANPVAR